MRRVQAGLIARDIEGAVACVCAALTRAAEPRWSSAPPKAVPACDVMSDHQPKTYNRSAQCKPGAGSVVCFELTNTLQGSELRR